MTIISIVIPVRNRQNYTKNILTQIYTQISGINNVPNIFVTVVDDGSTDGTKDIIQNSFPHVHLIEGDGSLWWAGAIVKGMEYGIDKLEADYIVWLNDDLCIADDFITYILDICDSARYTQTIVGGIVRDKTYKDWIVYSGLKDKKPISNINYFSSSEEVDADVLCGNIVIIPRSVIDKIGFPDFLRLPHHGSDYNYIMNAKEAGFAVIILEKIQAFTDYTLTDVIRYMPYWMQWYLQPSFSKRWEIIKGLTSLKANQNIWMLVNLHSSNRNAAFIPKWKYIFCYLNKLIRFLVIDFLPKKYLHDRLKEYLVLQNLPQKIMEQISDI